ncbi:enoyl-CoA hydratase-related protein [Rhodococcus sp. UYP9]
MPCRLIHYQSLVVPRRPTDDATSGLPSDRGGHVTVTTHTARAIRSSRRFGGNRRVDNLSELVQSRREGRIQVLTLNNPGRRNALSLAMREVLRVLLERVAEDVAGILITGADGYFCSGGDLRDSAGFTADETRFDHLAAIVSAIASNARPVFAAVEGGAFGAGLGIAAACDHVVCAKGGKLGAPFTKIGLSADAGLTWSLPRRIGPARANQMLIGAEALDARTALSWGLVDELADDGAVDEAAMTHLRSWLENAPLGMAASKASIADPATSLASALETEKHRQIRLLGTADSQEAVSAFGQRRVPQFRGR